MYIVTKTWEENHDAQPYRSQSKVSSMSSHLFVIYCNDKEFFLSPIQINCLTYYIAHDTNVWHAYS